MIVYNNPSVMPLACQHTLLHKGGFKKLGALREFHLLRRLLEIYSITNLAIQKNRMAICCHPVFPIFPYWSFALFFAIISNTPA